MNYILDILFKHTYFKFIGRLIDILRGWVIRGLGYHVISYNLNIPSGKKSRDGLPSRYFYVIFSIPPEGVSRKFLGCVFLTLKSIDNFNNFDNKTVFLTVYASGDQVAVGPSFHFNSKHPPTLHNFVTYYIKHMKNNATASSSMIHSTGEVLKVTIRELKINENDV